MNFSIPTFKKKSDLPKVPQIKKFPPEDTFLKFQRARNISSSAAGGEVRNNIRRNSFHSSTENVQFTKVRRGNSQNIPQASYLQKKNETKGQLRIWAERFGWCFCLFLVARLGVADRGIVDFYKMENRLNSKRVELSKTILDQKELGKKIDFLRRNKKYQKKMIRDLLGFIAEDEYLIVFPKES